MLRLCDRLVLRRAQKLVSIAMAGELDRSW